MRICFSEYTKHLERYPLLADLNKMEPSGEEKSVLKYSTTRTAEMGEQAFYVGEILQCLAYDPQLLSIAQRLMVSPGKTEDTKDGKIQTHQKILYNCCAVALDDRLFVATSERCGYTLRYDPLMMYTDIKRHSVVLGGDSSWIDRHQIGFDDTFAILIICSGNWLTAPEDVNLFLLPTFLQHHKVRHALIHNPNVEQVTSFVDYLLSKSKNLNILLRSKDGSEVFCSGAYWKTALVAKEYKESKEINLLCDYPSSSKIVYELRDSKHMSCLASDQQPGKLSKIIMDTLYSQLTSSTPPSTLSSGSSTVDNQGVSVFVTSTKSSWHPLLAPTLASLTRFHGHAVPKFRSINGTTTGGGNLVSCHARECKQPLNAAKWLCDECEKLGYPSFGVCSGECCKESWRDHAYNWHGVVSSSFPISSLPASPVMLVEVRDQEKDTASLLFCPRGRLTLEKICAPLKKVHIVAVVGNARGGKSSWLNWFRNYLVGLSKSSGMTGEDLSESKFDVSPGSKTVTSGLWLWSQAIPLPRRGDGSERADVEHVLLLDAEGTQRGRDSVTSIIAMASCNISTCTVINFRGGAGLTAPVIEFSERLANDHSTSLGTSLGGVGVGKRKNLVYRCGDTRQLWVDKVGDLGTYLSSSLSTHPSISSAFVPSMVTTDKPTDDDLMVATITTKLGTTFFTSLKKSFDHVLAILGGGGVAVEGKEVLNRFETCLTNFTSAKGKLIPARIERVQRQEAEVEYHMTVAKFKAKCLTQESCIPYYEEGSTTVKWVLDRDRKEMTDLFTADCGKLGISSTIVTEVSRRLESTTRNLAQIVVNKKINHDTQLRRAREEVDRLRRQEELRVQEEERKVVEERMKIEQNRLYELQQEQTRQTFALMDIHSNMVNKHFRIQEDISRCAQLGKPMWIDYVDSPMGGRWMSAWRH